MSQRKLIVLGTAAQVPTRDRNHSGYLLYWDPDGFLVDPGEGTQRQMTRFGVKSTVITKILITHFHGDHCLGLPGVIQRMALDGVRHAVDIYFPASGSLFLQRLIDASFHSGQLEYHLHAISTEGVIYDDKSLTIEARFLKHPIETLGYRIQERDSVSMDGEKLAALGLKGPAIGRLKEAGWVEINNRIISLKEVSTPKAGQSVAFVMDTAFCENAFKLAATVDMLVCESTFCSEHLSLAEAYGHLTAAQAAEIGQRSQVGHLILTHFSQRYPDTLAMLQEAKAIHPHTSAADDGDLFFLSQRKPLS